MTLSLITSNVLLCFKTSFASPQLKWDIVLAQDKKEATLTNSFLSRVLPNTSMWVDCAQSHLPKLTKVNHRIFMLKILCDDFSSDDLQLYFKYNMVVSEYCKMHDYTSGFIVIIDYRDINILNFLKKCSPMDFKHVYTVATEGYGMRIKRIDILTDSKVVDMLVSAFKQIMSPKVGGRIQVHKDLNTLHEVVDKHLLPQDYGGDEKPLKELFDQWLDIYCSKKNVEIYREIIKAKTDETCRTANDFNEQYIGMPGSFRSLSVD